MGKIRTDTSQRYTRGKESHKRWHTFYITWEIQSKMAIRYPHTYQNGQSLEYREHPNTLARMWSKRKSHTLLAGMQNGTPLGKTV